MFQMSRQTIARRCWAAPETARSRPKIWANLPKRSRTKLLAASAIACRESIADSHDSHMQSAEVKIKVINAASVTALLYPASKSNRVGVTIILGHGAGANQLTAFMRLFAAGLA